MKTTPSTHEAFSVISTELEKDNLLYTSLLKDVSTIVYKHMMTHHDRITASENAAKEILDVMFDEKQK